MEQVAAQAAEAHADREQAERDSAQHLAAFDASREALHQAEELLAGAASTQAGSRSRRSRLPRSVAGCPACANSQSRTAVTSRVSLVEQDVLGVEVAVDHAVR